MKKLMLFAAVALASCVVSASSCNWSISLGKADFGGAAYYGFVGDAALQTSVISALDNGGSTLADFLGSKSSVNGTLSTNRGSASTLFQNVSAGDSVFFLVFKTSVTDGDGYYMTDVKTLTSDLVYDSPDTPKSTFEFKSTDDFAKSGSVGSSKPGPEPTPEPTSGLLLLLGMAGLALKRKHA